MTTHQHPIGSRVSFLPGPRSTTRATGKVTAHGTGANGHFMDVQVGDRTYKVRPGGATKAL